jgi:hypothetical protein
MTDELLAKLNWRGPWSLGLSYKDHDLIIEDIFSTKTFNRIPTLFYCINVKDNYWVPWKSLSVIECVAFFDYITDTKHPFEVDKNLERAVKI